MSNLKTASVDISQTQVVAVIDWLNRHHPDARNQSMARDDVIALCQGDRVVMHEATMGVATDGVERIYAPGTIATCWSVDNLDDDDGVTVTLVIGPQDGLAAIVNCFSERDPSGYPFHRLEART